MHIACVKSRIDVVKCELATLKMALDAKRDDGKCTTCRDGKGFFLWFTLADDIFLWLF